MGTAEAVVEVQALGGAAGELGSRSELFYPAEGGVWGREVREPFHFCAPSCQSDW